MLWWTSSSFAVLYLKSYIRYLNTTYRLARGSDTQFFFHSVRHKSDFATTVLPVLLNPFSYHSSCTIGTMLQMKQDALWKECRLRRWIKLLLYFHFYIPNEKYIESISIGVRSVRDKAENKISVIQIILL